MENNNRYSKYLAIIALLISVVGVSLGFAAYSNTVQIKARADVRPDSSSYRGGELSTSSSDVVTGTVTPTTSGGCTAEDATINANGIEDIHVHFTAPDQSATYSFYGVNRSEFTSYLNEVNFGAKTCSPSNVNGNAATTSYVTEACNDIVMTIAAGPTDDWLETDNDVDGHSLASGGSETVTVTIEYLDGGQVADGDFDVNFGTSTLVYGTVD